jgi:hypothetical protein
MSEKSEKVLATGASKGLGEGVAIGFGRAFTSRPAAVSASRTTPW